MCTYVYEIHTYVHTYIVHSAGCDRSSDGVVHSGGECNMYVCTHLSGHDETRRTRVNGDIACHQPYIFELLVQFTVLLVAQCLHD